MVEIELSVEETNELRRKIGLPPIKLTKPAVETEKTADLKLELSVEETNRLRKSLGLRAIEATVEKELNGATNEAPANAPESVNATPSYLVDDYNSSSIYEDANSQSFLENVGKVRPKDTQISYDIQHDVSASAGLTVAHDGTALDDLGDGDVLVLGDGNVLDEENVLVNDKLKKADDRKAELSEKRKIARLKYGYMAGEDEVEDSKAKVEIKNNEIQVIQNTEAKNTETDQPVLGFVTQVDLFAEPTPREPVKMKKLRKKDKAQKRNRDFDFSEADFVPVKLANLEEAQEEEDYLEQALRASRTKKQKVRAGIKPEILALEAAQHQRLDSIQGGVVFDDKSDFLGTVGRSRDDGIDNKKNTEPLRKIISGASDELVTPASDKSANVDAEERLEDKQSSELGLTTATTAGHLNGPISSEMAHSESAVAPVSESEPSFSSLSSTLKYLRRGNTHISTPSEIEQQRNARQAQRDADLVRIQISVEERSLRQELENSPAFMRKPKTERAQILESELQKVLESKGLVRQITSRGRYAEYSEPERREYSPNVTMDYVDEEGNKLSQKEAFKQLSHKFHGTAPAKKKKVIKHSSSTENVL